MLFQAPDDEGLKLLLKQSLRFSASVLGLLQCDPEAWFRGESCADDGGLDEAAIEDMIAQRNAARAEKDFEKADFLRDALAAQNIVLEDGPDGTRWKRG